MRHRILIVDDENVERNGIKFLLKQKRFELDVIEASNGKEALGYLLEHPDDIDIIFTDIKMPFMDGIQLIKELHARGKKEYNIIIFSGYSEFEYAQFAMKMGVHDYILKPVDPVEFEKTIRKVVNELEEQELKKSMNEESITFMKQHILYSLLNGVPKEEVQLWGSKFFDLSFLEDYGRMCLFEFNCDFFGQGMDGFYEKLQQALQLPVQYINLNLQQGVFLFKRHLGVDYAVVGKMIHEFFHMYYSVSCYVAVSSEWEDGAAGLATHFEEVEELMEQKFYQSDTYVFLPALSHKEQSCNEMDDDTCIKQIKQDIKMKDMTRLRQHFKLFQEKYKGKNGVSQVYIKFLFSNLVKLMYDALPNEKDETMKQSIDFLYRATEFGQVIAIVKDVMEKLEGEFTSSSLVLHREIESIKQIIYENYNKELSVEQLAEKVYMAPSYLSHVFKKETGQNLSKFIKAYRMEKAKEMLECTHKKIVTISYEVGYSNVSYFCQSFREYFGVSPQKFRSQGVVDETEI